LFDSTQVLRASEGVQVEIGRGRDRSPDLYLRGNPSPEKPHLVFPVFFVGWLLSHLCFLRRVLGLVVSVSFASLASWLFRSRLVDVRQEVALYEQGHGWAGFVR
jgi:hypothetical protein